MTTCGRSPTSGRSSATRTNRSAGSSPGTSARSTSPGTTGGCSATAHSGAYLQKFAWTRIVRHQMVKGDGVPGRPRPGRVLGRTTAQGTTPADRQDQPAALRGADTAAARSAGARCCTPTTRHKAHASGNNGWRPPARRSSRSPTRKDGTSDETEPRLIHAHCHADTRDGKGPALLPAHEPQGLLEPDAGKPARTVLRGAGRSNAPGLPGEGRQQVRSRGVGMPGGRL